MDRSKILTNKAYRSYNYFSRYTAVPYYYNNEDKKYVYGTSTQVKQTSPFILHKIKKNDTLDTLSLQYYNNPTFFWAIADFNNIRDPYLKLNEGDNIKIPTLNDVSFEEN